MRGASTEVGRVRYVSSLGSRLEGRRDSSTPLRGARNDTGVGSRNDREAKECGAVKLEAEHDGAIGGQVIRHGQAKTPARLTTNGLGGCVPGEGGAEVVAVDGGGLLAACGEEKPPEEPAATAAPATPAATVETPAATPQAGPMSFRYVPDHTSGPRGEAMPWGLAQFSQTRPNVNVRFVPQSSQYEDAFAI